MVCGRVDRAMAALTEAVPSTRLPGRPLAEALAEFEEGLRQAKAGMGAWRRPTVEGEWQACDGAIEACLAMAERLRVAAPDPEGFEALIGTLDSLLAPLEEAFEAGTERFRALRT